MSIYPQNLASILPRTSLVKFARSSRTDPPGDSHSHSRVVFEASREGCGPRSPRSPIPGIQCSGVRWPNTKDEMRLAPLLFSVREAAQQDGVPVRFESNAVLSAMPFFSPRRAG